MLYLTILKVIKRIDTVYCKPVIFAITEPMVPYWLWSLKSHPLIFGNLVCTAETK